jgi:hypothetical protein
MEIIQRASETVAAMEEAWWGFVWVCTWPDRCGRSWCRESGEGYCFYLVRGAGLKAEATERVSQSMEDLVRR